MANEQYKRDFQASYKELKPILTEVVGQLAQDKVELSDTIKVTQNIRKGLTSQQFPAAVIIFRMTGPGGASQNLFFLDKALVLGSYAWMLGEEPADELSDEHFDGLKESVEQVFGQLNMNAPEVMNGGKIEELQVGMVESQDTLEELLTDQPGLDCIFTLGKGSETFDVRLLRWPLDTPQAGDNENYMSQEEVNTMETVSVQPAEFGNLNGDGTGQGTSRNVDMLLDVELEVSVELDRKTILVSELLKLGKGSIVELEKSAGEPLDIFVNGRKFAEGEVVVIDDKFGIRITQLLSPRDRLKSLG